MTDTSDWEMTALKTLKVPPSPSAPLFKKAWTAALLGFVLFILSFVLNVYFYERWIGLTQGGYHDIDDLRDLSWLSAIMGVAHFIGTVLMVASIVLVIRGLLINSDRQRSGTILIGTLKKLKWVAIIALMLYLLYLPLAVLGGFFWEFMRLSYYSSSAAFVFLAALPLIVAHALNKHST